MPTVRTVRGPTDVEELGQTLMHEHVFVLDPDRLRDNGAGQWWDEELRVADAVEWLRSLAGRGKISLTLSKIV